jgi:hypothetical protein
VIADIEERNVIDHIRGQTNAALAFINVMLGQKSICDKEFLIFEISYKFFGRTI